MATLLSIINDIELRVTAVKPTDDSRRLRAQIKAVLDDTSARMLRDRALMTYGRKNMQVVKTNGSWYSVQELEVTDLNGIPTAVLPTIPFGTVDPYGFDEIYTMYNDNGNFVPKPLAIGDIQDAEWTSTTPFGNIQTVVVPQIDFNLGQVQLQLYPKSMIEKVFVRTILFGSPKKLPNETPAQFYNRSINREYPVPPDLLGQIKEETVRILLGEQQLVDQKDNTGFDNTKQT